MLYYGNPQAPTWSPQNPTNPNNPFNPTHTISSQQGAQSIAPIPDGLWLSVVGLLIFFIIGMSFAVWLKVRKTESKGS